MPALLIEYTYQGNEDNWESEIADFIHAIKSDRMLSQGMRYHVFVKADGRRVHVPSWDSEETLKYLQSTPAFAKFTKKVKEFSDSNINVHKVNFSSV